MTKNSQLVFAVLASISLSISCLISLSECSSKKSSSSNSGFIPHYRKLPRIVPQILLESDDDFLAAKKRGVTELESQRFNLEDEMGDQTSELRKRSGDQFSRDDRDYKPMMFGKRSASSSSSNQEPFNREDRDYKPLIFGKRAPDYVPPMFG